MGLRHSLFGPYDKFGREIITVENLFDLLPNFKFHNLKTFLSRSYYQDLNLEAIFWAL